MYSDIISVQILVALLKEYRIRHIVLSPGNRNIPIVHSIENDPDFKCYSIVDERSAGYFALGIIQELNEPVAICCTSGTAACNYLPAVTEAFYQKLPLIVITADRNCCFLNQCEEQMIPQVDMFSSVCKKTVTLPLIKDEKDKWFCARLVNEALLEWNHHGRGPVHINVPIESDILSFGTHTLPFARRIERIMLNDDESIWNRRASVLKNAGKILVIYGQAARKGEEDNSAIEAFIKRYNCAIAVDHLSNIHCKGVIETFTVSRLMTDESFESFVPDILITVNGNYVSYIRSLLKGNSGKFEHWLVSEEGAVVDPFQSLTTIFECSSLDFFRTMVHANDEINHSNLYLKQWEDVVNSVKISNIPYSDLYATQQLMEKIPVDALLHLANSSSVRLASHFKLDESISVYCNRGTNGIDGSFSSFIGQSFISQRLCFLLIGDLSFFYDMNAIWNRYVGKNVRIMLNNNQGAGLFHFNIGSAKIPTLNQNIAAEHFTTAKGWVESKGIAYISARNQKEFDSSLKEFLSTDWDSPVLFEVFTCKEEDAKCLRSFYDMNAFVSLKVSAKNRLKSFLGR